MPRNLPSLIFVAAVVSAQDRPTFQADVSLVQVDAEVLERDGRVVTGLSRSDFKVFDEGREQPLTAFEAEEQPLDLILLFDISGSMRSAVEKVASASRQAMLELRRGDRVAVMTFNTSTRLIGSFTDDLSTVERDIRDILTHKFGGGTYIQQAVDDAAKYFLRDTRAHRRRAVLIITDNLGVRTRKEISVVRNLWEADALLSGLIVRNPGYQARRIIVAALAPYALAKVGGMDHIAERTGGDTIRSDEPSTAFPEMMHRIRNRYTLYYSMPEGKPSSFRGIRVELANEARMRFPGALVHARRGYRLTRPQ